MTVSEAKTIVMNRLTGDADLPASEQRKKLIIQNTHATTALYIKFVSAGTVNATAGNYDIQIAGKASFVLDNYSGPAKASVAADVNYTELG
jgi:hypothetical protein